MGGSGLDRTDDFQKLCGSGLDRTDDFQKLCGSGLDRIQLLRIRIGLGLKNFTVSSSLPGARCAEQCYHCFFFTRSGFLLFYLGFLLKIFFFTLVKV